MNKKPFETKVAIEVTQADHKTVQQALCDIGCYWFGGGTEPKECGKSISHICVTTLGTITMNTKGWDINYPIVRLEDVVSNSKKLHENRIANAQHHIKRLDGDFTRAALTYAAQVVKHSQKLETAQARLEEN